MMPENENPPQTNPGADALPARRPARQGPWLAVAIAALALAGWQWFETRQKLIETQQEVSRKLAEFDTGNKEERGARKQTGEQIEISARRVLNFKPSQVLKTALNPGSDVATLGD